MYGNGVGAYHSIFAEKWVNAHTHKVAHKGVGVNAAFLFLHPYTFQYALFCDCTVV